MVYGSVRMEDPAANFEGAQTLRVRTGRNQWQYIVNLYLEHDRARHGIKIDRDAVLEDLAAHFSRLAKSGRAFMMGDFQMRAGDAELQKWMRKLQLARLDTGPVHTHRHYSEQYEQTIDHIMVGTYNRWNAPALITDAEAMEWETGTDEKAPSDHRMILFTLGVHESQASNKAKKKLKPDFRGLNEPAKLRELRSAVAGIAESEARLCPAAADDTGTQIDSAVCRVLNQLTAAIRRTVPMRKVAGFNRSYDGRARHYMSNPAVRAALAAKDKARATLRAASKRVPKRHAKKAYKQACRVARDAQRTAERQHEKEQIDRLRELRAMKHRTAADQRELEQIVNFLKNKNPAVQKPLPGVHMVADPDLPPTANPAEPELTNSEQESAEAARNHLRKYGRMPPMATDDPKAVLANTQAEDRRKWTAQQRLQPTETERLDRHVPPEQRMSRKWTRIHCDGGCREHATSAGITIAQGPFAGGLIYRKVCKRDKENPELTCSCYRSSKSALSAQNAQVATERVHFEQSLFITDDGTNNIAEFSAVYHALVQAIEVEKRTHLDIRTDSEFVTKCITGEHSTDNPRLVPYLAAICVLLQRAEMWCISHIHREANKRADALATDGLSRRPAAAAPRADMTIAETTDPEYLHPRRHMQGYVGTLHTVGARHRTLSQQRLNAQSMDKDEVVAAIDWLKTDTAPGKDELVPSLFKSTREEMAQLLSTIFNRCWRIGHTAVQWRRALVRMLHKGGSVHNVGNYRGISLLDVMGKLYERVIYSRLEEQLVNRGVIPAEMYGFVRKHGQNHALYAAYESIKHNRRMGNTVVVCSADVTKAYPSMNRAQMLAELAAMGVGGNLFHAISSMYDDNRSRILTSDAGVTSSEYSVENGLREGAVLSPILYVAFCSGLMRKLKSQPLAGLGMHVGTEWTAAQMWADDLVLMTADKDPSVAMANMHKLQSVLKADATEKHFAYSGTKTRNMIGHSARESAS
eukprot:g1766.t1